MSFLVGPTPIFTPASQPQNNQPANDQSQSSQTQTQSQSSPPPVQENQPVSGASGSKNEGDAGPPRPSDPQPGGATAQRLAPADASSQSVVEAQVQPEDDPASDLSFARREAESARQAYIAQAIIDRVQVAPDSSIASLFETPEVEKPSDNNQGASLADVGEPEAAVADDPFADADAA